MTAEELIAYSLGKPGAAETFPWGPTEMIAMFRGRAYACVALDGSAFGVRCAVPAADVGAWRSRHPRTITPEEFLAQTGWARFPLADMPDDELRDLVDRSYTDVVDRLSNPTT